MSDFDLKIEYSDAGLNSVEGIAGITSKKKVNYFLHMKAYDLCKSIRDEMVKNSSNTQNNVENITEELAKKNRLLIHRKAFLYAKKVWLGRKKAKDEEMDIKMSKGAEARYNGLKTISGRSSGAGIKRAKSVKVQTFKVFRRDDGRISRYTRYKGKIKQGVEYAEMSLDALKAFQESKFRKAAVSNIARTFMQMAIIARDTKNSYCNSGSFSMTTKKNAESSNSVRYWFGYATFKAIFYSYAFGKKHFPQDVYKYNWWLKNPKFEGRDMYHGSLNEKSVKAGLQAAYNDVYKHIKEKGLNIE